MSSSFNLNAYMEFVFWWTSSSGDNLTRDSLPESLRTFLPVAQEGAEIGFSLSEMLFLLTEVLMIRLNTDEEVFTTVQDWLNALGNYWSTNTTKLTNMVRARIQAAHPRIRSSFMVYQDGQPRESIPDSAATFYDMVQTNTIDFRISANTAPENEPRS